MLLPPFGWSSLPLLALGWVLLPSSAPCVWCCFCHSLLVCDAVLSRLPCVWSCPNYPSSGGAALSLPWGGVACSRLFLVGGAAFPLSLVGGAVCPPPLGVAEFSLFSFGPVLLSSLGWCCFPPFCPCGWCCLSPLGGAVYLLPSLGGVLFALPLALEW